VGNVALISSLINSGEKRGVSSRSAASEIAAAYAGSFSSEDEVTVDGGVTVFASAGVDVGVGVGVMPLLRKPFV